MKTSLFSISPFVIGILCLTTTPIHTQYTASWYDNQSCRREGTSGIMANGKPLDDSAHTCASWDYPFGTKLNITNVDTGKSVLVVVTDRGPAKRLYRQGRVIDLSKAAFKAIGPLKSGIVPIDVKEVSSQK